YLRNEVPPRRGCLIVFLSKLNLQRLDPLGIPPGVTLTGDLDEDIKRLEFHKQNGQFWPWEMLLRAVRHHRGKLKRLILFCSTDTIQQAPLCGAILRRYSALESIRVQV